MQRHRRFSSWNLTPAQAIKLQNKLRRKIKLNSLKIAPKLVAGADVSFKKDKAVGVVVVMTFPDLKLIESICKTTQISFPYIPGLLTFREGPVLERCFKALKNKPDVIIFDGQGIAHPRNMGIATHMGIILNRPTIGCAKTWLWGKYKEPRYYRGAFSYLLDKGKKIGVVLRTQDHIKPVFVSPGHKSDIRTLINIILICCHKYRLPQPLRLAHQLTQGYL